jgi:uncharacterized protein (UPF0335 family)
MKKKVKTPSSTEEETVPAARGHNRVGGVAVEKLKAYVERYEHLEEEKSAVAEDMRELLQEVKGNGFDTKIFKALIKLRATSENERIEYFAVLDTYARALGFSILDLELEPEE